MARGVYVTEPRYRIVPAVDDETPQESDGHGVTLGPHGCRECGCTGRRRRSEWIPFEAGAFNARADRIRARYQRWLKRTPGASRV